MNNKCYAFQVELVTATHDGRYVWCRKVELGAECGGPMLVAYYAEDTAQGRDRVRMKADEHMLSSNKHCKDCQFYRKEQ